MSEIEVADHFYPGISIHRTLRRSPSSIIGIHEDLLRVNGFRANKSDLVIALAASRGLYAFLNDEAADELKLYTSRSDEKGRPIRGPVVVQFDLVIQILSQMLEYAHQHPRESLEAAAAFAVLEDYLEKKLGPVAAAVWRKVSARRTDSTPRREIIRLLQIERIREIAPKGERRPKRISRKVKTKRQHS